MRYQPSLKNIREGLQDVQDPITRQKLEYLLGQVKKLKLELRKNGEVKSNYRY